MYINNYWKKYWSEKFIFKNKKIETNSKINVLKKCVIPVLTYAVQTWSITENN